MYHGHRILALIPARGDSKGVPGKNIRPLAGRPLIAWTIEAARASRHLDRLVLSSENDDICRIAEAYGCEVPFHRPPELARDDTPGIAPVLHAVEVLSGFDYVVLLQPTSPFRSATDIDAAIARCIDAGAPTLVSVTPASQHPSWMYHMDGDGRLVHFLNEEPIARRQELPRIYALNGAIYVAHVPTLQKEKKLIGPETIGYVMPRARSLDIDTALDFDLAEVLARRLLAEELI
ncbi:MAG: acylneuraminate cytidylyltransferase family protein [Alphaproteobacteria bacterium]|nr:MAG: acylneuraminate cytidylyltransferase family protein [Alphaproteobacteria bacterium]